MLILNILYCTGRVNALEAQLARIEGAKRDVEFKLSSIHSSLRRTLGFRQEMPRMASPLRARSPSPRRGRPSSPTKGMVLNIHFIKSVFHLKSSNKKVLQLT